MLLLRIVSLVLVSWLGSAVFATAHLLNITRAEVSFDQTPTFKATFYVDFSRAMGSGENYYQLSLLPHAQQETEIRKLVDGVLSDVQFMFGDEIAKPALVDWDVPKGSHADYADYYMGKMSRIDLQGTVPDARGPFALNTLGASTVEFPLALTVERPDHQIHITRWLELPGIASDSFNFDQGEAAKGGTYVKKLDIDPLSGAKLTPFQRFWYVQFGALSRYFHLGFEHIIPRGYDHILFILGLFFLGITWRKLVTQVAIFTLGHATTLYLSAQGIFSLPYWLVNPAIAFSIVFIALENIFRPRLNATRLVVVFFFGLVHGLGFASGLKALQLPTHEFYMGLIGFNFGVDVGQLFVLLLAFMAVGWMRTRPWYFQRVAVPASALIACIGGVWAVQRIWIYAHAGGS
jgi:hypothetical protein